jgi:hypothetical protein
MASDLLFKTILPYVREELQGEEVDLASLEAVASLQTRVATLPGTPLLPESLPAWVSDVTWAGRYATSCYGTAGEIFLELQRPGSRSFRGLARS